MWRARNTTAFGDDRSPAVPSFPFAMIRNRWRTQSISFGLAVDGLDGRVVDAL
jgi:hypothetical protein